MASELDRARGGDMRQRAARTGGVGPESSIPGGRASREGRERQRNHGFDAFDSAGVGQCAVSWEVWIPAKAGSHCAAAAAGEVSAVTVPPETARAASRLGDAARLGVAVGNLDYAQDTTAPRGKAKARRASQFAPTFRLLFVGHDPVLSPEASIVLAAVAARNGLRCDGAEMEGRTDDNLTHDAGRGASLSWVAQETGLHVGAVRRGVAALVRARQVVRVEVRDEFEVVDEGLFAQPEALARRWANHRLRIRLDEGVRRLGLRAKPLLLAGLVLGQVDRFGRLALGIDYLSERTGLPRRTVQRALATAERFGALHKWTAPIGGGQLFLAPGPSRSGARERSRSGARVKALEAAADGIAAFAKGGHREVAQPPSQSGATHHRELAPPPSQSGARHPDCPPESQPDSPTDARQRVVPEGETKRLRPAAEAPAAPAVLGTGQGCAVAEPRLRPTVEPEAAVQGWVGAFAGKGIDQLEPKHDAEVAGLFDQLCPPAAAGDRRALFAERRQLAARAIAWCPSPARLGECLLSVWRAQGAAGFLAGLRAEIDAGGVA